MQEHCVYLALSDTLKVGVTRATQVPTRWIDQGAHKARVIARTPNRFLAGKIEVALKSVYTDKTNWRKMLTHTVMEDEPDWKGELERIEAALPAELLDYLSPKEEVHSFSYPVESFPAKVKSVGFDKEPEICGRLSGIKGQYLIFADSRVLNIRRHTGYEIELSF